MKWSRGVASWMLPAGTERSALTLLFGRGLRAFADGFVAVLLPAFLLAQGFGSFDVGLLGTATLAGSALLTLAVGAWGHRFLHHRLLLAAALLMTLTGIAFATASGFWLLLVVAVVGTLNPSSGDVSVFLPLEHARLADAAHGHVRTRLVARYSLIGALAAACGALAAAWPDAMTARLGIPRLTALRAMFLLYGAIGLAIWVLYRGQPDSRGDSPAKPAPLGVSRPIVLKLAALFAVDSFAGGFVVNSLLALWLLQRFGLSLATTGVFFFWAGLLAAASQLAAPRIAQRIGLVNTMVFTHIPASVCLIGAALAPDLSMAIVLLLIRSALSSMDVPARSAFVMAVVTPPERASAASVTAVPRSLAAAASPALAGALFAMGAYAAPLRHLRRAQDRLRPDAVGGLPADATGSLNGGGGSPDRR